MKLIYLYSIFLILGMILSQLFEWAPVDPYLNFLVDATLAYIMIEVGLEFDLNKKQWKKYLKDYGVASLAAGLPWIFCFIYFLFFFQENSWEELLLIARFAAPTSSGILFSMLAAAGLATTWIFKKIQVLAIFDDLDTILLLIPIQFLLGGVHYLSLVIILIIVVLLVLSWRYLHRLRLPSGRLWLIGYGVILTALLRMIHFQFEIELEILLPAFVLGTLLYKSFHPSHEQAFLEPTKSPFQFFDRGIKVVFMFMVGLLLPKVLLGSLNPWVTALHILAITLLSNLGKCFPLFCYKQEATLKQRAAISIGMFPRGEVGAGILVLAIAQGAGGYVTTLAQLSLALNLILTPLFITWVIRLQKGQANT